MPYKEPAMARARRRNREHLKRVTLSDITAAQELAMRKRARKCPLCGVSMTSKPHLPNSKELDHIVPVNQGGTHTHGNVRIICRQCNQKRPKDGSDYLGQVTLWAQVPQVASRRRTTCRKGLHLWITGQKRCEACHRDAARRRAAKRYKRAGMQTCKCGKPFSGQGNTFMCPDCTDIAARKATELHAAGGMSWDQVAVQIGYKSGWGAAFAAKRIGYVPTPKTATPKEMATCACGGAAWRKGRCKECIDSAAQRAVQLRRAGWTLRSIADELGYDSISSVTNLISAVVPVKPYSRSLTG